MFDVFNSEFENRLSQAKTYKEAFHEAHEDFTERHGFIAYPSYDSFRKVRSEKRKRRR